MKTSSQSNIKVIAFVSFTILSDKVSSNDEVLKLYSSVAGGLGNSVTRMMTDYIGRGLKKAKHIFQCSGPLPVGVAPHFLGPLTQAKHTWIKSFGETYGMPFTLNKSYFGGDAMIMKPDPFVSKNLIHNSSIICDPITYSTANDEEIHEKKIACIIEKISKDTSAEGLEGNSWVAILDYHALANNCSSAVRFAVDCADSQMSQTPNFNIGSFYDVDKKAKIGLPINAPIYNQVFDYLDKLSRLRRGEYIKRFSAIKELELLAAKYFEAMTLTEMKQDDFKLYYDIQKNFDLFIDSFKTLDKAIHDQGILHLKNLILKLPKYRYQKTTYADICYKARKECE